MSLLTKVFPQLKHFHLDDIDITGDTMSISGTAKQASARCPVCGRRSRSVHSWYARQVADLPVSRAVVVLRLRVRRFFCRVPSCPRRIFTERLPELVASHGRWSQGLRAAVQQIGFALGGEAGARLAQALGMRTSPDTLLNLIRATPLPTVDDVRLLGLDEWAWRKGRRFGTILVDLARHRVIALLPERSADATVAWLAQHPEIEVITRDRSKLYADAATRGAPQAVQVVDRFHLIRNLSEALEAFLRSRGACLKDAALALVEVSAPAERDTGGTPDGGAQAALPLRPRRTEEASMDYHRQRVAAYEAVHALRATGADVADIARTVGISRQTAYRYVSMNDPPARRRRRFERRDRGLDPYEDYLRRRWSEGCHNGMQLWREIRAQGFAYSSSPVSRFVAHLRQDPSLRPARRARSALTGVRGPSAREVALLFLRRPADRTAEQEAYLAYLLQGDADIAAAYAVTQDFATMLRQREGERLDVWIEAAAQSGIDDLKRFALGLRDDYAAVQAGLTLEYSNGQVEGQVTRLKLVRRGMYGHGHFDLLQRRVLSAA
jgi:transposase